MNSPMINLPRSFRGSLRTSQPSESNAETRRFLQWLSISVAPSRETISFQRLIQRLRKFDQTSGTFDWGFLAQRPEPLAESIRRCQHRICCADSDCTTRQYFIDGLCSEIIRAGFGKELVSSLEEVGRERRRCNGCQKLFSQSTDLGIDCLR